jgi:hydroxymethylpyrimidine pyrophosphatase-like HAD family hydrolase
VRYHALACDYDGTLASGGRVARETASALRRLRASGRRLLMVTGRQMGDLLEVCPEVGLFDRVVAENGAVVYAPASGRWRALADAPPQAFITALRRRGVEPLALGQVVVATLRPHDIEGQQVIRELGLDWRIIFNREAVMMLPARVDKATGLAAALEELGVSAHNVVAVGDGENDDRLLALSECGVAVANAVPELKANADLVTSAESGAGVVELIDRLIAMDLAELAPRLGRHDIPLGTDERGVAVRLAHGATVLVAGAPAAATSAMAAGLVERIAACGYQEGIVLRTHDDAIYPGVIVVGDAVHLPRPTEVAAALDHPLQNAVLRLDAVAAADRPHRFELLLSQLFEMRTRTGRPHWIVIDEADQLCAAPSFGAARRPEDLLGLILVAAEPRDLAPAALAAVDVVVSVGAAPAATLQAFADAVGEPAPATLPADVGAGEAIAWWRRRSDPPVRLRDLGARATPSNEGSDVVDALGETS